MPDQPSHQVDEIVSASFDGNGYQPSHQVDEIVSASFDGNGYQLYHNSAVTLQVMEQHGWTNNFFSMWFSNFGDFSRVHDKKLSIVAICALL